MLFLNKKRHNIFFYLLIACIALLSPLSKDVMARIYIDITAPILRKIPIEIRRAKAYPNTFENKELSKSISNIVGNDLEFHGFFKVFLDNITPTTSFNSDSDVPCEYYITNSLKRRKDKITIELRLFDAKDNDMLAGRRYKGSKDEATIRRIAHRFSDLVVQVLTGGHGVSLSKIAFIASDKKRSSIFTADFDGFNLQKMLEGKAIKLSPAISPDGRWLTYTSYVTGRPFMYIQDMRTKRVRRLTGFSGINISSAWRPDGRRLAVTLSKDGNPDIYLIDTTGNILERLTRGPGINCSPSWSPDGGAITFVSDRYGRPQIFVMDMTTRKTRRITYKGGYNTDPKWSPRGNKIAYVSYIEGHFQVFTISPMGGEPTQLTFSGNNENPSWSPDGRQILFSSDRLGKKAIFVMDVNGRRQRRLIDIKGMETKMPFWGPNKFR